MPLTSRQKLFFFTGLNISLYGVAMIILGARATEYFSNGAAGAPMYVGIFLIMCGVWNIVVSIDQDQDPKMQPEMAGPSMGVLIANMMALILGVTAIGLISFGAGDVLERGIVYGANGTERQIELFVSIFLLGAFSFILAMVVLLIDCGCFGGSEDGALPAVPVTGIPGVGVGGGAFPTFGVDNSGVSGYPYF